MSSKLPYFRWHPKDFDTDEHVRLMDMCEVGLYVLCLNHSWINGSLPDDVRKIAKIVGQPLLKVKRSWSAVSQCFVKNESGNLVNPKQEKERTWAVERSLKSKDAVALRGKVPTTTEPSSLGEVVEKYDHPRVYGSEFVSGSETSQENSDACAYIDFQTFLHRWKQHRGLRKPPANIREHAQIKWTQSCIEITETGLAAALDAYEASDWAKREGYPMIAFLKNPHSWCKDSVAVVAVDWDLVPGLLELKEEFDKIGAPTIAADWGKASPVWSGMTLADQEKAKARVPDHDGAYMKRPLNYLKEREFDRAPRPAPKSRLERAMDLA